MLQYLTALFVLFWGRNGVEGMCLESDNYKRSSTFFEEKVHPAGGFSDLEMTWLLYYAGAATDV